jgi:type I restriction enzyme S subunit
VSTEEIKDQAMPRWDIPESWQWVNISDIGQIITGNTPSTKDKANYGKDIPFVKPPELNDKGIWSAPDGLSNKGMKRARQLPPGAVLVSCIGGLGKTGIARVPVTFNQQINAIVFDERVIPEFGFYYTQTLKAWLYSVSSATTLAIVNKGKFQQASFPLASIEDQKRIVAEIEKQFSRLDEAVANLKRVKAKLKRYKAAVLKAAVEGRLTEEWRKDHPEVEPASELLKRIHVERKKSWAAGNPGKEYKESDEPETSNLPALPDTWVWSRTDQLFHYVTSGSRGWASYYSESGPAFLRMGNLDHDTVNLDLSDIQRVQPPRGSEGMRTRVLPGDILISITADVGMVGIAPTDFEEAYINQHVALARPVIAVNHVYLAWYLAGKNGQDQLQKLQRGATKVGLGLDDIKSVDVPLPPIKEQQAIVAEFERRLSIVNELQTQVEINIKRAENLRQAILKSAFTGNILSLQLGPNRIYNNL